MATGTRSTPDRAHPGVELDSSSGVNRLADLRDVVARYRRDGPHTTVTLPIATSGHRRDDTMRRWGAIRTELGHAGATDASLDLLTGAIELLHPSGHVALVTADDTSVAYCWLTTEPPQPVRHVGDGPGLLLAALEGAVNTTTVAAAVDRIGADLYRIDHVEIDELGTVDGDEDVHKPMGGGAAQQRLQRHSEQQWRRNADEVAGALRRHAERLGANRVVLSGEQRAVSLVRAALERGRRLTVTEASAGGRHEPATPERLLRAAIDAVHAERDDSSRALLGHLDEELGQQDRAVAGEVATLEALTAHRVGTLVVDVDRAVEYPHADAMIAAAASSGAELVPVRGTSLPEGVACLLRVPYEHNEGRR